MFQLLERPQRCSASPAALEKKLEGVGVSLREKP